MKQTVKAAFLATIPVLCGYLFVGIAFGMLLQNAGYSFLWALLISLFVYAGSMQFVMVGFLSGGVGLLSAAATTLAVNSRHMFYGLTFLEKFQKMGARRPYMIFSLTDETYSLLCSVKTPEGVEENLLYFSISLMNHLYWILGSALGALLGAVLPFDTTGIDFAMTALFTVILTEQLLEAKSLRPALVGFACGVGCLLLFGPDGFILPALSLAVALLMLLRPQMEMIEEGKE